MKKPKVNFIIDWYIIRKFLTTFFFTALLFSLISIVIDLAERLEAFIKEDVSLKQIIFDYYIHFILFINGLLWPLFALISVIFFTSRMAKNSEIISCFNAGMSLSRLLRPYIISALILVFLHLSLNHIIIPEGNKIRIPFENTYIKNRNDRSSRHVHMMVDPNTKMYIRQFNLRDSSANELRLEHYNGSELQSFIEARQAKWLDQEKKWQLKNYTKRSFNNLEEVFENHPNGVIDTAINITPTDIIRIHNQHLMFNSQELSSYISSQKQRGVGGTRVFETELYRRSADPFSIFILSLIGYAVASRKVRGGMGLHLAVGIVLGALYIILGRFSLTFTNAETIGPFLGVWLPNLVFSLVALYLLKIAQK